MIIKESIGGVKDITVTVLIENNLEVGTIYLAQHALSLMIDIKEESKNYKIMFDAGAMAQPIIHNMKVMDVNIRDFDSIILSHCHLDHTGGLIDIIESMDNNVKLYCHSTIFRRCFKEEPCYKNCSLQGENVKEHILSQINSIVFADNPIKVTEGVMTTGEITQKESHTHKTTYYTINEKGEKIVDTMNDETALIINVEEKGLVIITGCCHSGIINTIEQAIRVTGINKIFSIIGGLHMHSFKRQEVCDVVDKLNAMNVEALYLGHCTGEESTRIIKEHFNGKCESLSVGKYINIS